MLAALDAAGMASVFVHARTGEGKIPEGFTRHCVLQAHLAFLSGVRISDPLDGKPSLVGLVCEANNFADADLGSQSGDAGAFAAYVRSGDVFRKRAAMGIGAEDSDRHLDFLTRLPALTHAFGSTFRAVRIRFEEKRWYRAAGVTPSDDRRTLRDGFLGKILQKLA